MGLVGSPILESKAGDQGCFWPVVAFAAASGGTRKAALLARGVADDGRKMTATHRTLSIRGFG